MGMGRGMGMGGGKKFPYPKWVWTPAGGWWCQPKNANRNTAIMAGAWAVILAVTFKFSAANERRYLPPIVYPIPSQRWCKYAVEDDPRLAVSAGQPAVLTPSLLSRSRSLLCRLRPRLAFRLLAPLTCHLPPSLPQAMGWPNPVAKPTTIED